MSDDSVALLQMLAGDSPLDAETIRDGFMWAVRAWDAKSYLALLTATVTVAQDFSPAPGARLRPCATESKAPGARLRPCATESKAL